MAEEDDEKSQEPTPRKLQQAREKGDIIYSPEVGAALSLVAITAIAAFMSGPMARDTAHSFVSFLSMPDQYSIEPNALRGLALNSLLRVFGVLSMAGRSMLRCLRRRASVCMIFFFSPMNQRSFWKPKLRAAVNWKSACCNIDCAQM